MRAECFDFNEIVDQAYFFCQFSERFALADRVINDLDDLWEGGWQTATDAAGHYVSIWDKGRNAGMAH